MAWKLNHEIILQEATSSPGRAGSKGSVSYTDHITRAALLASRGGEALNNLTLEVTHRRTFVIRYHPDVNESWRIIFDNYAHDIKAIDPIPGSGRNRFLRVECEVKQSTRTDVSSKDTGPQPLFATTTQSTVGAGNARQNFDVQSYDSQIVNYPAPGTNTSVNVAVTDATPAGKYIVFLYPQAWGNPTAFHYRGDTLFNQIGAFRFVPANLLGTTNEFSSKYRAMVSVNRKLTDTPVFGTITWDLR